jgi:hypothetical protein
MTVGDENYGYQYCQPSPFIVTRAHIQTVSVYTNSLHSLRKTYTNTQIGSKWLREDLFVFVCTPPITDYASDLSGVFDAQRCSIFCKMNSTASKFKYN